MRLKTSNTRVSHGLMEGCREKGSGFSYCSSCHWLRQRGGGGCRQNGVKARAEIRLSRKSITTSPSMTRDETGREADMGWAPLFRVGHGGKSKSPPRTEFCLLESRGGLSASKCVEGKKGGLSARYVLLGVVFLRRRYFEKRGKRKKRTAGWAKAQSASGQKVNKRESTGRALQSRKKRAPQAHLSGNLGR